MTGKESDLPCNQAPMYQTYPQDAFAYGQWSNATYPTMNPTAQFDGVWQEGAHQVQPMTTYDMPTMFHTSDDVAWPTQEQIPAESFSHSPTTTTSPVVYQGQSTEWNSMPPQESGYPSGTWMSNHQPQPNPSPLSEAPSYGNYTFNHRTPSDYEPQSAASRAPFSQQHSFDARDSSSPVASTTAPVSKPKTKGKGKSTVSKPSKKTAETSKARASSGTKRKSPAPSTKSNSSENSKPPPPFLGIFPPDVDPREASAKMQREAWERCKNEAMVMSQRRLLLLDHERGALERETQKLQDNLALMREAAAREHGQLKEAVRKAERLDARGYY
ncbi:hypothetical protein QBC41DRAFT_329101 [Cercophora samala]|uniref:Uncharacterized protein n=1 Tax=Cercophora samala TaxID=330535 RepID=A0AA40D822_9PEZI|nr:hypothetical protein QBC41DRAFT_329101 [Cercophora samala]